MKRIHWNMNGNLLYLMILKKTMWIMWYGESSL